MILLRTNLTRQTCRHRRPLSRPEAGSLAPVEALVNLRKPET